MENLPEADREAFIEEACLTYPTWFFEVLTELEGKPLVLEDFQIQYLLDDARFTATVKSRQAGGSLQVAYKKGFKAYRNPGYRCDIVSVTVKEAADKIKYIRNFHDSLPARWQAPVTIDNVLSIGFHHGSRQSVINSLAASAGIRGGKKDIVFDEAAFIPKLDEMFIAAAPATIRGGGGMDLVSSPAGAQGLFPDIVMDREIHGKRPYGHFSRHKFYWFDVSAFTTNRDEARRAWREEYFENIVHMPELVERFGTDEIKTFYTIFPYDQFLQEFCCEFTVETDAFFTWELIAKCTRGVSVKGAEVDDAEYLDPWTVRPKHNTNKVVLGVDLAQGKAGGDETSLQACELLPQGRWMHRYSENLRGDQWRDPDRQINHIATVARRLSVNKINVDATGFGDPIVQGLKKAVPEIDIEPVVFNSDNKEQMAINLKSLMEQGRLWIQADDTQLKGQIANIKRTLLPSGRLRYAASREKDHDDMFWALCLAVRSSQYRTVQFFRLGR